MFPRPTHQKTALAKLAFKVAMELEPKLNQPKEYTNLTQFTEEFKKYQKEKELQFNITMKKCIDKKITLISEMSLEVKLIHGQLGNIENQTPEELEKLKDFLNKFSKYDVERTPYKYY